jgi:hypothetical protein
MNPLTLDRQLLHEFHSFLPENQKMNTIWLAGISALEEPLWFYHQGHQVDVTDSSLDKLVSAQNLTDGLPISFSQKDLRLFSPKKETLDGIWCRNSLISFSAEETQRVLASFFSALKPKTGILFVMTRMPELAFQSLLRQSGFQVIQYAPSPEDSGTFAWFLKRI